MTPSRTLLGMLTPSSNTILEPVSAAMLAGLPDVSAHFSRFEVTEISLQDAALNQFDGSAQVAAAELLAHANVGSIIWNGTSSGWLGFDADERLCSEITSKTGIPASTSVLAMNEILEKTQARTYGLVTPYIDEIQQRIIANYHAAGLSCAGEVHFDERVNFAFSEFSDARIEEGIREVAKEKPDAIMIFCTNLIGAPLADELEKEIGIPIYDTVSTAVWKGMLLADADPARITGWGRLFQDVR